MDELNNNIPQDFSATQNTPEHTAAPSDETAASNEAPVYNAEPTSAEPFVQAPVNPLPVNETPPSGAQSTSPYTDTAQGYPVQGTPAFQPQFSGQYPVAEPKKKSGKVKFIVIGIIAALIVIIGVVFALCFKSIKIKANPEKYVATAFAKTGASLTECIAQSPVSVLGSMGKTMLDGTMDYTFSSDTVDVRGTYECSTETNEFFSDIDVSVNGESISAKSYYGEDMVAVSLKELFGSDKFYGYNPLTVADDLDSSAFAPNSGSQFSITDKETYNLIKDILSSTGNTSSDAKKALSDDEISQIIEAYQSNHTVETGKDKIFADGKQITVHTVKYVLTKDDVKAILAETYSVLKESDTFKKFINGLSNDENAYENFLEEFKQLKKSLPKELDSDIEVTFYINNQDEIVFAELILPENEDAFSATFNAGSSVKTAPEISLEISAGGEYSTNTISAVYNRSGMDSDVFSEEFVITSTDKSEYSTSKLKLKFASEYNSKTGDISFNAEINPNSNYSDKISASFDGTVKIDNGKITLDFKDSKLKSVTDYSNDEFKFDLYVTVAEGCNISKPQNFENIAKYSESDIINLLTAIPFIDSSRYTEIDTVFPDIGDIEPDDIDADGIDTATLDTDAVTALIALNLKCSTDNEICIDDDYLSLIGKESSTTVRTAIAVYGGSFNADGDKIEAADGEDLAVPAIIYQDTSLSSGETTVYYSYNFETEDYEIQHFSSFEEACNAAEGYGYPIYTIC